ncbi:sialic acid-binding Ig-like lectin 10 [Rana temporaria]|uniref:sialic acid-binding Ig-like lectin 10 n=1 Tax=Rana temporaria TaxID=8407 RepID=UPI001AACB627|nr:sialic acid-binding Ig-like lectin 10 [Rana temporaria]
MAGEEVTLTCTSPGRCNGSAPLITWSGVQGKNITYRMDYLDGNKTYYSNITFIPSRVDHNSSLSCTVTFQRSNATTSQQISLNVEYPPYINIAIKGNTTTEDTRITVLEGDSLVIECIVDSNPQANISWHDKDSLLRGPLNGELLTYELRNITSNDAGRYQCSAQNNHWIRNRTIDIIVHYPPYINITIKGNTTTEDTHITVLEGDSLVIECIVDSNPQANISWHDKDSLRFGPLNRELLPYELRNITSNDAGRYQCSAQNNHWIRNRTIDIIVHYKPREMSCVPSCCLEQSSKIKCQCIIMAFPEAITQWKVNEESYPSSYNKIDLQITTDLYGPLSISILEINVTQGYMPNIQCSSSNQQGELVIKLLNGRRTLRSSYTTIILAVVFAILFIAVLSVIGLSLIHYYRKRKLKQIAEKKTECSTDCKEIYRSTTVFFNEGYKPEGMPEDRAPADEEDERYATIIFPQRKPRASVEEVETGYVCGSTAAVNGTSMPVTFI